MNSKVKKETDKIINGTYLKAKEDCAFLLEEDLESLKEGADLLRRHFLKNSFDICSMVSAKSGNCSENCRFCSQSAHYKTACKSHGFLNEEEIESACKMNEKAGVTRFAVVTSGRTLDGEDFEKELHAIRRIHKNCPNIEICASNGLLKKEQFVALKNAGVTLYHENIETSPQYFKNVCSTHTQEEMIERVKWAKEAGLMVCCGGIIGMGESFDDRISMALKLSTLDIDSIPLNILMPIEGTPLAESKPLTDDEILRTFAIFRFINPKAGIRIAAGRIKMKNNGEEVFKSGCNAAASGNMLTTPGNALEDDLKMFRKLGFDI